MIRLFLLAILPLLLFAVLALSGCAMLCEGEGKCEIPVVWFSIPLN